MTATALIIDDEPDIRELIALTLSRMGLDYRTAANLEEARQLLNTYSFDVCLTDMRLPDGNGVDFVRYIQSKDPNLPVAVITAHGNMDAAVTAMKNGAYDFVTKPVDIAQLRQLVVQAIALNSGDARQQASNNPKFNVFDSDNHGGSNNHNGANHYSGTNNHGNTTSHVTTLSRENTPEQEPILPPQSVTPQVTEVSLHGLSHRDTSTSHSAQHSASNKLVGKSRPMQSLREMIAKVARTNAPVWITGESGTGKELIAKLIHESGPRANNPFVAINCGAIPSELMESELFGHLKGSFTGAVTDKKGLFQHAHGGTLFFDEVAELPLHMQVKLLRAIQERSIRPVGGTNEIAIDTRILSASHKDLATEVEAGRFRHDLYYRLNVIKLHSPSLRDRCEDIPELCSSIMEKLAKQSGNSAAANITDDALDAMADYNFPGNVRELENLLERSIALIDGNCIDAEALDLPDTVATDTAAQASGRKKPVNFETSRIIEALNNTRWNRKEAAQQLGLTYRQLRYRIQQLGIDENK